MPEDMPKRTSKDDAAADEDDAAPAADRPSTLSAALIETLTVHRTAAIAAELMERPNLALAALVHTLAAQLFIHEAFEDRRVGVTL